MTSRSPDSLPLAVTMGDPAGIGLEITLAAWADREVRGLRPFVLYADPGTVAARAELIGWNVPIAVVAKPKQGIQCFHAALPVIAVPTRVEAKPGRPDPANAAAVIHAIELAVEAVVSGGASAIVTNPISKSVLHQAGFRHPGHTEFLGALADHHFPVERWRPVMMLAAAELRVVPLTVHVPLSQVPRLVTRKLIAETARITWRALRDDFGCTAPRIAVAGLNPHAGEDGNMGTEDRDVIAPAVAELRAEGLQITGPHPADTLFHAAARRGYDAVIAMYHDQALIPLKTLAFDRGVNVTLGLPFVRTSPDHGTAFDIAGQGRASAESLIQAMAMADAMARQRAGAAG
jgi:4-hydroxythreonine-4-phosphate dehydrogenase